jgi:NADH:ubiquinone oxidoreductase subunit F (NADH-binding)/Pyruvate/2-oxoacid:ferredoxin oxidoreductase delta subunit/(2Fe-2S) ferredoxin
MIQVKVGLASCGIASGAKEVYDEFIRLKIPTKLVGCIGACYAEPLVEIKKDDFETIIYQKVSVHDVKKIVHSAIHQTNNSCVFAKRKDGVVSDIDASYLEDLEYYSLQEKRVSKHCGIIDPEDIQDYILTGGYTALKKVVAEKNPEKFIDLVSKSGLRGRGGAGFPTGKKWGFFYAEKSDHKYLICNFDEGDPGSFMNRVLVESDPHLLIEGMLITSMLLGVTEAFIYTRAEYPLAVERLKKAISQAKVKKLLGKDSLTNVTIEIRLGAGAYVCGEETALIASIESNAGRPRPKPPFPAKKGLWGKPTLINNVETLSNIPLIINNSDKWYRKVGTNTSPGTKMFSFSGHIKRGGYIEVPLGTKLSHFLKIADANLDEIKGVHIGGPSGGTLSLNFLDLPVDYDNISKADAIMGSGSLVIIPKTQDMVELAKFFLEFSVLESCGKCVPCREGTTRLLEIISRIIENKGHTKDLIDLEELSLSIRDSSFCGLGKAAPNPVISSLKHFREDYISHFIKGALDDPNKTFFIEPSICTGCSLCDSSCPVNAISGKKFQFHRINQDLCIRCGKCFENCKIKAIKIKTLDEISG